MITIQVMMMVYYRFLAGMTRGYRNILPGMTGLEGASNQPTFLEFAPPNIAQDQNLITLTTLFSNPQFSKFTWSDLH